MEVTTSRRQPAKKLLSPKELTACNEIAQTETDYSQRAKALILVNAGSTHVQAAQETGLTLGQFKYWLTRFRKLRLSSFPEMALNDQAPNKAEKHGKADKSQPEKAKKKNKDKKKTKLKDKEKKKEKKKEKDDKKSKKSKKAKKKK